MTLEDDKHKQVLYDFNRSYLEYDCEKPVHVLFEEQVNFCENKLALVCQSEHITYGELNKKANQLAGKLRSLGVKSDTIVGLAVNRSLDMFIGIMGILKAGGCYLPVDPAYPESRIQYMLEDSNTNILLTQKDLLENINFTGRFIYLDDESLYTGDDSNLENINSSSDLIYVIYTSGSTGKPKGVMLEHKAVHNFIKGVTKLIDFPKDKTIVNLTTISFDIFVLESLLPLSAGMKIVIADPMQFSGTVGNESVDMLQTTPSTMQLILNDKSNIDYIKGLSEIMLGGEAFPKKLLQELKKHTNARIFNMYGPTETTVWSAIKELTHSEEINIGKPIANTQIYIVDENNAPLTVEMPGELCISGDGLARGYLNRSELTNERFVDNPVIEGRKIYKTGDMAKWLQNGEIEFLGRIDSQVKIRGFRIELGEIEDCLGKHEKIKGCVVAAKEKESGEKYLVAYYLSDEMLVISDIISFLRKSLPDYMIPGFYMRIEKIPLTPNNKIDRKSLPKPGSKRPNLDTTYIAPVTSIENTMADIWRRILDCEIIGIHDNFFELGGNSILTSHLYIELEKYFPGKFSLVDVFAYPSISKLVKLFEEGGIMSDLDKPVEHISGKDIAIIGVACRFAASRNKEEYWQSLKNGEDCIRELPENRKKLNEAYLRVKGYKSEDAVYYKGGFLEEIDKFDCELFNISPAEAGLMSPNQRVFLETAWSAIEDAGYGDGKISGTRTGVFLGHSTDFGVNYKDYIEALDPSMASYSISGNLNSIIAGRISYLLDLKGPGMIVDTACSSSLAAIHIACRSIRNGECDIALVGAVKIDLLPLESIKRMEDEIGITSSDGRARTFDDSSEGTGLGEGVGAILIKPLDKALKDRDNIYAVIKGSAMNQDGSSVNLTSPNPAAQDDVIIKAWRDAGIDPETITYMEAHGTGTELGDPIEIKGLERAFGRYTNRKQFCGIGSVKTNIGHLDNAAGMAGLIKAILALKNKEIPASIHFNSPSRKINFEDTPLYVNCFHRRWDTDAFPRRCGISAFGLSGTNCHVVLEEAPEMKENNNEGLKKGLKILALSAKNREGILELLQQYQLLLDKKEHIDIGNLCYTANTGRDHHNCRLGIIFEDIAELRQKLEKAVALDASELIQHDIFHGTYRIISKKQESRKNEEITQDQKVNNTNETNKKLKEYLEQTKDLSLEMLREICRMYVSGSDIEWDLLYKNGDYKKVSLPSYPFSGKSCWVSDNAEITKEYKDNKVSGLPLFERCLVDSFDRIIYSSSFDADNYWILNEHKVSGSFVVPGTAYLEMVTELLKRHYDGWAFRLKDVVFISPLGVKQGEMVEVHTVIKDDNDGMGFTIAGRSANGSGWNIHAEGRILLCENKNVSSLDIEKIKEMNKGRTLSHFDYKGKGIETGPRWECMKDIYVGGHEILAHLCLNEIYINEANLYNLHPALLDEAVNVALRSIGEDMYLPFSYKSLTIYGRLPGRIYSHLRRKDTDRIDREFAAFDITLTDEAGNVIMLIEDYTIKKADEDRVISDTAVHSNVYSQIVWVEKNNEIPSRQDDGRYTVILKGEGKTNNDIVAAIKKKRAYVVEVEPGTGFEAVDSGRLFSGYTMDDYSKLLEHIKVDNIGRIIYMQTLSNNKDVASLSDLDDGLRKGVKGLFNLVRAVIRSRPAGTIEVVLAAQYANMVNDLQRQIIPLNAALLGLGKVISLEYPKIKCRCVDIDDHTKADIIVSELDSAYDSCPAAYRYGKRYVPCLDLVDINNVQNRKLEIKEQGVYVITGGTGGIGLEVAEFLSSKAHVNIALINRSTFPAFEKWAGILESGEDARLCSKVSKLINIKKVGSNIILCKSNVSDMARMKEVLDDLKSKFGRINGIFHTAGNAGDGFIIRRDENDFEDVLAPKIQGTWILDRLTMEEHLDFFVMFSSISSIAAEAGQGDYTAANSFLDSYSDNGSRNGGRYTTINWPAWAETGMAVDYGTDLSKEVFSPIGTKDAIEALDIILDKNIRIVIIGELDYDNYAKSKSNIFELSSEIIMRAANKNRMSKRKLQNYSGNNASNVSDILLTGRNIGEPYTEMEKKIADVIGNALGLKEMNIHDGFLDSGGNSIIAVKVEMDMEKNGIPVSIQDLYEYKTVMDLAEFVDGKARSTVSVDSSPRLNSESTSLKNELKEAEPEHDIKPAGRILLDNVRPFNEVFYKTCFHNSLFPVIEHFNKSLLPILNNDIFIYEYDENRELSHNGMADITDKTLNELLKDMGVIVQAKKHVSLKINDIIPPEDDIRLLNRFPRYIGVNAEEAINSVAGLLDDVKWALTHKRPVIIWVDCFYESVRKDTYNKEHWMHTLLLYGFDENREVFFAIEHNFKENLTYKEQEISYKDIVNAYEGFVANYLPYVEMPSYYEFFLSDSNVNTSPIDTIPDKYNYYETLSDKKDRITAGLQSLEKMAHKLGKVLSSEQELKGNADSLMAVLNSIINAKQLERYNISNVSGGDSNIISGIEKVIEIWTYIRQIIVKYSYSSIYNSKKMAVVVERINEVCRREFKYYSGLFTSEN